MPFNVSYLIQTPRGMLRELGARVRDRRIAAHLTQVELARRAGVSRPTIARIERGENIGVEALLQIAIALDTGAEFGALFPPKETRSLDEILAAQRKPERVRHVMKVRATSS